MLASNKTVFIFYNLYYINNLFDKSYFLECINCKKVLDEKKYYFLCNKCSNPVDIIYDYNIIREQLNLHVLKDSTIKSVKYLDFFPIKKKNKIITLDEGGTPLYRCKNLEKHLDYKEIYVKYEGNNPTGAFKDRGTMVELSKANEFNASNICVASTGNMAASVSAYAAKLGIPCYVLVPEGNPVGKLAQTLSYGGRILQIKGTYNDAAALAIKLSVKYNFFVSGDYCFRREGQKSCAYEIIEQLNWTAPDKIIVPTGYGTNLAAIWKGLKEFKLFDLINSLPKMVAVQSNGCNPIVNAFNNKLDLIPVERPNTIATAVSVGNPFDWRFVINALNESQGSAESLDDNMIIEAQHLLSKLESIFVEPSAAIPLASLISMIKNGNVKMGEKVVLVLTGNGLKDSLTALKSFAYPPAVIPKFSEVKKFVDYKLYDFKSPLTQTDKLKPIFSDLPDLNVLSKTILDLFNINISRGDLKDVYSELKNFVKKMKVVTVGDLSLMVESVLTNVKMKNKYIKIRHYNVTSQMGDISRSTVKIEYLDKKIVQTGEGVGPVDSIINAVKKVIRDTNGLNFELLDYQVTISSGGPDATVNVKMYLKGDDGKTVFGIGNSPDIIEASIRAFENSYNVLYLN